jgi:hypothetical protein
MATGQVKGKMGKIEVFSAPAGRLSTGRDTRQHGMHRFFPAESTSETVSVHWAKTFIRRMVGDI